jgi:D-arabinose 1-dehydrogenase-like Zn-dependent alcohol dehydrogenase
MPGDLVAVQGVGGLGLLGVQFASKFGYRVAAIGRGAENGVLAKKLGARVYIDSNATNAAEGLQKLGGAQVILAIAPNSKAMSELIDGLGPSGKLMVVGAMFDPIEVSPIQLINGSRSIQGWSSGTAADSEDTLRFAELPPPDIGRIGVVDDTVLENEGAHARTFAHERDAQRRPSLGRSPY